MCGAGTPPGVWTVRNKCRHTQAGIYITTSTRQQDKKRIMEAQAIVRATHVIQTRKQTEKRIKTFLFFLILFLFSYFSSATLLPVLLLG